MFSDYVLVLEIMSKNVWFCGNLFSLNRDIVFYYGSQNTRASRVLSCVEKTWGERTWRASKTKGSLMWKTLKLNQCTYGWDSVLWVVEKIGAQVARPVGEKLVCRILNDLASGCFNKAKHVFLWLYYVFLLSISMFDNSFY